MQANKRTSTTTKKRDVLKKKKSNFLQLARNREWKKMLHGEGKKLRVMRGEEAGEKKGEDKRGQEEVI